MKVSNYTVNIPIDMEKSMLYSTLTRKYYVYKTEETNELERFLNNLNRTSFTMEEISLFRELLSKKLIQSDNENEYQELSYRECEKRFQANVYKIVIYATNACNFRCTYCEQNHEIKSLNDESVEKILLLIEEKTRKFSKMQIDWFGGEPLLEYEKICTMMRKIIKICEKNNCELLGTITTNGYLLDEDKIKMLRKLNIRAMQITIDGNRDKHDATRILVNGDKTYDVIFENLLLVLQEGIKTTLRINVDRVNEDDAYQILNEIPKIYRDKVYVCFSNVFQNKEKISMYPLIRKAMERGYCAHERWNEFARCHACYDNSVIIDTDASILLCTNTSNSEKRLGYLNNTGNVCIERTGTYYELKNLSTLDNVQCQNCKELPFCIGDCKYARMQDNTVCIGRNADGLTLQERALLDYYYDIQKSS